MRIALMSDIHGNYEALKAFEKHSPNYDELYCLGDVVGYGPSPENCVLWIKDKASLVIQGNHERALFDSHERHLMNVLAREQILWTKRHLSPESLAVLSLWPEEIKHYPFWLCHGSPSDPDMYIMGPKEASLALYRLEETGLFFALFGHTHYPGVIDEQGNFWYEKDKPLFLHTGKRYLINPGSIGQPRDGDPRLSFCVLTSRRRGWEVTFFRYEYDIESTIHQMLSLGIQPELAYRLLVGR
ncbi:MAG: metallophosphatase family protein [Brevinematales bacterium]|nr:metallophosphatase family protein [Brevinematales bacterium]